jgi:hypothetical protein
MGGHLIDIDTYVKLWQRAALLSTQQKSISNRLNMRSNNHITSPIQLQILFFIGVFIATILYKSVPRFRSELTDQNDHTLLDTQKANSTEETQLSPNAITRTRYYDSTQQI